ALGGVQAPIEDAARGKTKAAAQGGDFPVETMKSKAKLKNRRALAIQTARSLAASGQDLAKAEQA
ncbi:MAG TPA: hypothetical protein VNO54_21640, partial [Streptosporangiaceae bacterium]|nr:hypothetical protein [Streptosporangiaceae bacterium]